jgi:mono/diheme cytochrome c family protein
MSSETNKSVSATPDSDESPVRGATVPIWLIILMVMLLYWGALYFDNNGGWFSTQVYAPYHSMEELEIYHVGGGPNPAAAGKAVYDKTCVACHQATGQGAPGQFPPLVGSEWVNEAEPGRVIRIVLQGLQGPITVKGQPFNNAMVPWNSLSDEDIANVISYVRQNTEWGNKASLVTPAQVKAMRDKVKNHPGAFTADELLKIAPNE